MGITTLPEGNKEIVIYESGNYIYVCSAALGTAVSTASWQIIRFDTTNVLVSRFADRNDSYDNLATDLATVAPLSYS